MTDYSVKDIEELHNNEDPLDGYSGKWACLYVWPNGSSLGKDRWDRKEDVEPGSYTKGRRRSLEEAQRLGVFSAESGLPYSQLLYWQPIPVED